MTEKLYYLDSHMFEFEAEVLECRELERGWGIILDRTAFFPEGGGQPADTGVIGGVAVTDVQERGGEIILAFADTPVPPVRQRLRAAPAPHAESLRRAHSLRPRA